MTSVLAATLGMTACAEEWLVYFGTFTGEVSKGIYVSRLDSGTGRMSEPRLVWEIASPNYLAVSPDGRFLFAATRPNADEGFVDSFRIERPSGSLAQVDIESSGGAGPCHVSLDETGRTLVVANYSGGSVKSFRVSADGHLAEATLIQHEGSSVNPSRQAGPHAHCIMPAPGGGFALVCDLGLDKVMVYRLDHETAALTPNDPAFASAAPGSGPRHLVFSPDGESVYVVNEMACTLSAFDWNAKAGALGPRQSVSLLPDGVEIQPTFSAAAIAVRPDGRFIYATVRGHNSVSVFSVGTHGGLQLVQNVASGGKTPRGLGIDPTGRWLFVGNQDSDLVSTFSIVPASGRLATTDYDVSVGSPVDMRFVRAATHESSKKGE